MAAFPQTDNPSFFPIKLDDSGNQKVKEAIRIITENLRYAGEQRDKIVGKFASPTQIGKDTRFDLVRSIIKFFEIFFKKLYWKYTVRRNILEAALVVSLNFGWNFRDVLTLWLIDGLARNMKYEEENSSPYWLPVEIEGKSPLNAAEARSWARSIVLHERWALDFLTPTQLTKNGSRLRPVRKKEHDSEFDKGFKKISAFFPENQNPMNYLSNSIELKLVGKSWYFRTRPEYQSSVLALQHAYFRIREAKIPEQLDKVNLRPPFASLSYLYYNNIKDPERDVKTMIKVLKAGTQKKGKSKKENGGYDTFALYKAFTNAKVPEEVEKYLDANCPDLWNCHSYFNALRFEFLLRMLSFLPDSVWLTLVRMLYGPEPIWPSSLITERFRRANDPDNPWTIVNNPRNVESSLGMSAGLREHQHEYAPGISIRAIPPSPVKAYFFPGRTDQRALIIGGVHGSEQSGIEVVEKLRTQLIKAPALPYYTTIIIPVLFPDSKAFDQQVREALPARQRQNLDTYVGGRYVRVDEGKTQLKLVEPNRNFPLRGQSLDTALKKGLKKKSRTSERLEGDRVIPRVLPENIYLLKLIERFLPCRIASVHGHVPSPKRGDAPGIYVDSRGGFDFKGKDVATTPEGKYDDNLALKMLAHARQLRRKMGMKEKDKDNPKEGHNKNKKDYEAIHYDPEASKIDATSLGDWAPVPVKEDGPWDRPGITTITVEVESNYPSNEDSTGEMENREQVHCDTLLNVFLEQH